MVDRFILTGPPGAGKTTILQQLAEEGFATADEAATDVIAAWRKQGIDEPWTYPLFVDAIVESQRYRQLNLDNSARIQFYDRSPICTLALAEAGFLSTGANTEWSNCRESLRITRIPGQ